MALNLAVKSLEWGQSRFAEKLTSEQQELWISKIVWMKGEWDRKTNRVEWKNEVVQKDSIDVTTLLDMKRILVLSHYEIFGL